MPDLLFASELTVGIGRLAVPPTWQGSARRHLGFAVGQQARRDDRPNRVRHPTDRSFASWCSPPPLAGTQFLSATEPKSGSDRDSHPAGSTHSRSHWPQVFNLRNQPCADSRPARRRPCGRCGPPPPSRPPRFNPEWSYHIGQESATDGLQPGQKKAAHLFSRSSWKKRSAKQGSNPPRVDDGSLCKRPGRRITRIAKHRGIAGQGF